MISVCDDGSSKYCYDEKSLFLLITQARQGDWSKPKMRLLRRLRSSVRSVNAPSKSSRPRLVLQILIIIIIGAQSSDPLSSPISYPYIISNSTWAAAKELQRKSMLILVWSSRTWKVPSGRAKNPLSRRSCSLCTTSRQRFTKTTTESKMSVGALASTLAKSKICSFLL